MKKLIEKIIYVLLIACLLVAHSENFISYAIESFEESQEEINLKQNAEEVLENPTTDIDMQLSENTFYTLEENKIDFMLTLKNSSKQNELFENPRIEIELPKEIEQVSIDRVMVLYKNGLNLSKWQVIENENGIKYLHIELEGKQEEYQNSEIIDGTNIIIKTTIKPYDTTPIKKSNLKLRYENLGKSISYEQQGKDSKEYEIEFMSKFGLLTLSSLQTEENIKQRAIGDSIQSIKVDVDSKQKAIDFNMMILNNYTESLENVEIIGAFPIENNEKILDKDLKNTFTMAILEKLNALGVENKIYYSSNTNPNSEDWVENIEELENVSLYKIEIGKLEPNQYLKFNYKAQIPENLTYNQSSYSYYEVNYDYKGQKISASSQIGVETQNKEVTYQDCLIKEEKEFLNIGLYSAKGGKVLEENTKVHEGQIIDYAIVLENKTNQNLENLQIDTSIINGNFYEWAKHYAIEGDESSDYYLFEENNEKEISTINIENINPGETKIIQYSAIIKNKNQNEQKNIYSNVNIYLNNEKILEKDTIKNEIKESKLNIRIAYSNNEADKVSNEETICTALFLNNKTDKEIEEQEINLEFFGEVELSEVLMQLGEKSYEILEQKVENNKTKIKLILHNIEIGESIFAIPFNLKNYDETKIEDEIYVTGFYEIKTEKYNMNNYKRTIYKKNGEIKGELISNFENENINDQDEISYTFSVKNTGIIPMDANVSILSDLGLNIEKYELKKSNEIIDAQDDISTNYVDSTVNLDVNESAEMIVYTKFYRNLVSDEEKELTVVGNVNSYNLANSYSSNEVNYPVLQEANVTSNQIELSKQEEKYEQLYELLENTPKSVKIEEGKYKITGQVWLDKNRNGLKDYDETNVEKVKVKLYENTSELNQLKDCIMETFSESGSYCFENIPKGKYIVVFEYDNTLYDVTLYQQNDETLENSSAVQKTIESKDIAVTNIVEIEESDISSLNLGLCEKEKFDLKIQKNIYSVTVKNDKENKTTKFSGEKLVKEEIDPKYLEGTKVTIVYDIIVSNIGDIPGYANEVIDYLPEGLDFSKENNEEWYLKDNILFNTSLNNTEIKPGEKKNLKLVLTKVMDSKNTGIFKNVSEIKLSTNFKNIEDKQLDNNKDEVTIIISIQTGKIILFISVFIIDLLILTIGIWQIKKKVL